MGPRTRRDRGVKAARKATFEEKGKLQHVQQAAGFS